MMGSSESEHLSEGQADQDADRGTDRDACRGTCQDLSQDLNREDGGDATLRLRCTVNGKARSHQVPVRMSLADYLREVLGLTGTHLGCEQGVCGACTVRADGDVVRACLMLAVQAEGMQIDTIEGLTATGEVADLQDAFYRHAALQCGFCTAGMLITADAALRCRPGAELSRDEVRQALTGNLCRCTGYHAIVDAVVDTSRIRRHA